jgi:hypothetical protein
MSAEIKMTVGLTVTKGFFYDTVKQETLSIDQTTQGGQLAVVSVGTAEEDLAYGDVVTPALVYLKNLDTTNFVTYGPKSAGNMILFGKILPGEVAILRLGAAVVFRWKADTGAVKVLAKVYEL